MNYCKTFMREFDAIIIGSGQGGNPLAKKLAEAGLKTALIEKDKIGGTCINYGCTPTKTMIASAKTAYTISKAAKLGIKSSLPEPDIQAILRRKTQVVESFRGGTAGGLNKTKNLEVISGTAAFTGTKQIEVTNADGSRENLTAARIFINAGTHPSVPDIEGIQNSGYVTSAGIMELKEIPEHLFIIGGSYIALEFGQMYRRFGSRVTIIERQDHVLAKEDEDITAEVQSFMKAEGIGILLNASVVKVEKDQSGLSLTISISGSEKTIKGSHLLVAAGRAANTEDLNLASAGVETDKKGYIRVNEFLETSAEGIYAIGDIKGGPKFTHVAYNDHLILAENILKNGRESTKHRLIPYCMFTDPQMGRIGLSEKEAREQGFSIKVATLAMSKVARAIETGDERGLMKAVIDSDTGQILGAAILGEEGGEVMSVLQMAMYGKIPYTQIRNMMFAHPLYSESLNNLFMTLDN